MSSIRPGRLNAAQAPPWHEQSPPEDTRLQATQANSQIPSVQFSGFSLENAQATRLENAQATREEPSSATVSATDGEDDFFDAIDHADTSEFFSTTDNEDEFFDATGGVKSAGGDDVIRTLPKSGQLEAQDLIFTFKDIEEEVRFLEASFISLNRKGNELSEAEESHTRHFIRNVHAWMGAARQSTGSSNVESSNVESSNVESSNVESSNVESSNVESSNVRQENIRKESFNIRNSFEWLKAKCGNSTFLKLAKNLCEGITEATKFLLRKNFSKGQRFRKDKSCSTQPAPTIDYREVTPMPVRLDQVIPSEHSQKLTLGELMDIRQHYRNWHTTTFREFKVVDGLASRKAALPEELWETLKPFGISKGATYADCLMLYLQRDRAQAVLSEGSQRNILMSGAPAKWGSVADRIQPDLEENKEERAACAVVICMLAEVEKEVSAFTETIDCKRMRDVLRRLENKQPSDTPPQDVHSQEELKDLNNTLLYLRIMQRNIARVMQDWKSLHADLEESKLEQGNADLNQ